MAVLYGYFDESGKPHQQPVVVFSGFLGTWEQWEDLSAEWNRLLRSNNIQAFHFAQLKKRTSLVKKFISVIKENIELGISFAIKVADFNALPSHIKRLVGQTPDFFAFRAVIHAMSAHVGPGADNVIHFTCDEEEQRAIQSFKWYKDVKRDIPALQDRLVSFCMADDRFAPQLQAADLFAALNRAEANRVLLNEINDSHALFDELTKQEPSRKLSFKALFVEQTGLAALARAIEEDHLEELYKMHEEGLL